ncbi:MAG: alpha/beta hydrolase [Acidobacteriota bacterium]
MSVATPRHAHTGRAIWSITVALAVVALACPGLVLAEAVLSAPPANPDPDRYHLVYLHGAIVEGSDGRPVSPDYGPYEYAAIVDRFLDSGFVTLSEIRPNNTDVERYATKVVSWIGQLLAAGVPAGRITIVGASKGGVIASLVSHQLQNEKIKYVILAGLFATVAAQHDLELHGEVLSIHDEADKFQVTPEAFFERSEGLANSKSLVTRTGLGHGLLYQAHPEWFDATVAWSGIGSHPDR